MTIERMIELLEIEHECMLRGAHDDCDRKCADCELVQEDDELHEMYTNVVQLLKEHEARWILCSNRLPKSNPDDLEYPTVIIALEDGTVELGCYYESTKEWGAGENFDRLRQPVAWMPLPEPYTEGR